MLTPRGWSYSDARRRRRRSAYRLRPSRTRHWSARRTAPALAALAIAVGVWWFGPPDLSLPTQAQRPEPVAAPTLDSVALMPLPTLAPTLPPTAVPTPKPTPVPIKPLLPQYRIVAYYGNPLAKEMGVLGEFPQTPEQMLAKLDQQAQAYAALDRSKPVMPALELVTPAAQGWAGDEGLYRARMTPEIVDEVAGWAESRHALLILDAQIGLSSVPQEVDALLPYLKRPNVHLALDPEFAIPSGHIPGEVIGTLDAAAIDGAIRTLSQLVASEHLPPKILIVHRFTDAMVTNSWAIAKDPNVQVVTTMDGFGPPGLKLAQYHSYVHDQGVQFAGVKLFYHHDVPLLSPADVLHLDPVPDLVIYQ